MSRAWLEHFLLGIVLWAVYLWLKQRRVARSLPHPIRALARVPGVLSSEPDTSSVCWRLLHNPGAPHETVCWVPDPLGVDGGRVPCGRAGASLVWHDPPQSRSIE